mgnify:CR=1 FL=1
MKRGMPTRLIGACMGLAGFALAIVAGLAADNPSTQILVHALLSMLGCQMVGLAIGAVAEHAIDERSSAHRVANPIGAEPAQGEAAEEDEGPILVV